MSYNDADQCFAIAKPTFSHQKTPLPYGKGTGAGSTLTTFAVAVRKRLTCGNGIIRSYLKTNRELCHCKIKNVTIRMRRSEIRISDCCSRVALLLHSATRCCPLPSVGNYGCELIKHLYLVW